MVAPVFSATRPPEVVDFSTAPNLSKFTQSMGDGANWTLVAGTCQSNPGLEGGKFFMPDISADPNLGRGYDHAEASVVMDSGTGVAIHCGGAVNDYGVVFYPKWNAATNSWYWVLRWSFSTVFYTDAQGKFSPEGYSFRCDAPALATDVGWNTVKTLTIESHRDGFTGLVDGKPVATLSIPRNSYYTTLYYLATYRQVGLYSDGSQIGNSGIGIWNSFTSRSGRRPVWYAGIMADYSWVGLPDSTTRTACPMMYAQSARDEILGNTSPATLTNGIPGAGLTTDYFVAVQGVLANYSDTFAANGWTLVNTIPFDQSAPNTNDRGTLYHYRKYEAQVGGAAPTITASVANTVRIRARFVTHAGYNPLTIETTSALVVGRDLALGDLPVPVTANKGDSVLVIPVGVYSMSTTGSGHNGNTNSPTIANLYPTGTQHTPAGYDPHWGLDGNMGRYQGNADGLSVTDQPFRYGRVDATPVDYSVAGYRTTLFQVTARATTPSDFSLLHLAELSWGTYNYIRQPTVSGALRIPVSGTCGLYSATGRPYAPESKFGVVQGMRQSFGGGMDTKATWTHKSGRYRVALESSGNTVWATVEATTVRLAGVSKGSEEGIVSANWTAQPGDEFVVTIDRNTSNANWLSQSPGVQSGQASGTLTVKRAGVTTTLINANFGISNSSMVGYVYSANITEVGASTYAEITTFRLEDVEAGESCRDFGDFATVAPAPTNHNTTVIAGTVYLGNNTLLDRSN